MRDETGTDTAMKSIRADGGRLRSSGDAVRLGDHRRNPAVVRGPGSGVFAHPADRLDDFRMDIRHVSFEYRLVVSYPVSKSPDHIEPAVHEIAPLAVAGQKYSVDCGPPDGGVVMAPQQANPKGEFEFGDDTSRREQFAAGSKLSGSLPDHPPRIGRQGRGRGGEPVFSINSAHLPVDGVPEADLKALERRVECL